MKIDKKELDALTAELTLVVEKDDYMTDYEQKMKSYQQKAQIKGFRKGKTPMGLVKKMYGSATMQESVSKVLGEKINAIISGDEYNIIGEPLFLDEGNIPEIDHNSPTEYAYRFEIGMEPEFDVKGAGDSDSYTKHKIIVSDDLVNEEMAVIKKRMGKQIEVDDTIQLEDVVYVNIVELDGKNPKDDGLKSDFSFSVDQLRVFYRDLLVTLKKGDNFDLNVFEFEEKLSKEHVIKHLLKIEDATEIDISESAMYRADITKVVRLEQVEFNQEIFDSYFGKDQVTTIEEAREKIRGYISEHFDAEAVNLLNREIMQGLVEKNQIELPISFIKKWVNKEQEMPEDQFDSFLKELKWRIIKKKLVKKHDIQVEEKEILDHFVKMIRNYSPYIDEATLKNTVFSLMKNREQVNSAVEAVSSGKLFDKLREVVVIVEDEIGKDDFLARVKEINLLAK